ncbi:MAG TPA: hypothetical protein ENI15_03870, partial [Spirochaetes bacterium]|nr:hypothetical protein [Spirochaetota bacterium]
MKIFKGKKMWKIVFITACVMAGVFIGTAVFAGKKDSGTKETGTKETAKKEEKEEIITIEIWDWQAGPAFDNAFEKLVPVYEAMHPNIKIDRTGYNLSEWDELIKTALLSGDLPDLFGLYQGPQLWEVADTGILFEWDDVINADPVWKANLGKNYGIGGTLDRHGNT